MRIHIGERDRFEGRPLDERIVELLRARHFAGVTVLRGIAGFGAGTRHRTHLAELLSPDLPIIIESVETDEKITAVIPELDAMLGGGLITLERAQVIMYRPGGPAESRTPSAGIDITAR